MFFIVKMTQHALQRILIYRINFIYLSTALLHGFLMIQHLYFFNRQRQLHSVLN